MENYEIKERLGRGSFGKVAMAIRKKDNRVVAIKEVDYSNMLPQQKQWLVNEVNFLKTIHNEHIVRYIDRIVDRENQIIYLVMEYCEQGDLQNFIRKVRAARSRVPEGQIWQTLSEMCLALQDCHYGKQKVIHRDIKPGNIFIDQNGHIKLGDFGIARDISDENASTYVGTPYYMSPELQSRKEYNEKSDIWALGCCIYEMAELSPPFMSPDEKILAQQVKKEQPKRIPSCYSDSLMDVLLLMLEKDPVKRPSVKELLTNKYIKLTLRMTQIQKERDKLRRETESLKIKKAHLQSVLKKLEALQ